METTDKTRNNESSEGGIAVGASMTIYHVMSYYLRIIYSNFTIV